MTKDPQRFRLLTFAVGASFVASVCHGTTLREAIQLGLDHQASDVAVISNAEADANAGDLRVRADQEGLGLLVSEVFLNALHADQRAKLADENLVELRRLLKEHGETGDLADDDRVKWAQEESERHGRTFKAARALLSQAAGSLSKELKMPTIPLNFLPSPEEGFNTSSNWEYRVRARVASSAEANVDSVKATWLPRLNLEARDGRKEESGQNGAFKVGSLKRGKVTNAPLGSVGDAVGDAETQLAASIEAKMQADRDAGAALSAYQKSKTEAEGQEGYLKSLAQLVIEMEQQFLRGEKTLGNLLDVRTAKYRADSTLVDARISQRRHAYRLLASTGRLLQALEVRIPSRSFTTSAKIAAVIETPAPTEVEAPPTKPQRNGVTYNVPLLSRIRGERSEKPAPTAEKPTQPEVPAEPANTKKTFTLLADGSIEVSTTPENQSGYPDSFFNPNSTVAGSLDSEADANSQIVAVVEPVGADEGSVLQIPPPSDLLPVSREATRRKRKPAPAAEDRKRPLKGFISNLFKRSKKSQ